jgi:tetratricopeptide (TPR) repeat protein
MKRITIILLFISAFFSLDAYPSTKSDKALFDSLLCEYNKLPQNRKRFDFMQNVIQLYSFNGLNYLIKKSILDAQCQDDEDNELLMIYCLFCYYYNKGDNINMDKTFQEIRNKSYAYQQYFYYFSSWYYQLLCYCGYGQVEYVIQQAKQMEKEAKALKDETGMNYSQVILGSAYLSAGRYQESIKHYLLVLKNKIYFDLQLLLYIQIADAYTSNSQYNKALYYIAAERKLLYYHIDKNKIKYESWKSRLMDNERRCAYNYLKLGNISQAKIHLDKTDKLRPTEYFAPYEQLYHSTWAEYYCDVKDWKSCIREINLALSIDNSDDIWGQQSIRLSKAKYLWKSGNKKAALDAFAVALQKGDTIINDIRVKQAEIVKQNFLIKKELLKKVTMDRSKQLRILIFSLLILCIVILVSYRIIHAHWLLLKDKQRTLAANEMAIKAKNMKEIFIKNVINDINAPLDNVVALSKELSLHRDELPVEKKEEYAHSIKDNSDRLIVLVTSVLDLSRLESGMMKFNVSRVEVVQLFRDAVSKKGLYGKEQNITFETEIESSFIDIDQSRLLELFSSLLVPLVGAELICRMRSEQNGKKIIIEVIGSSLSCADLTRLQEIRNQINSLFLKVFNGSYLIYNGMITITLIPADSD